jgi:hypothetical protein
MQNLYKFGYLAADGNELPYQYPNVWARERTTGPDRFVIAPHDHYIRLLLELAECLEEPLYLLYILTVPRGGGEAGRYESKKSFTFDQLQSFLYEYVGLLEKDARNSIWIQSQSGLLVYDLHNVIYAYGPLEMFQAVLQTSGLSESSEVRFPSPHVHRYHFQFDDDQSRIMREAEWIHSPLRPGDENPNDT